jgi:predicted nucleic acid-binding protein
MILADTSVWVDHFRHKESSLSGLLEQGLVLVHPFVIGELACGNLKNRDQVLDMMSRLPMSVTASDAEVLEFIERKSLYGRGIGYIDMHLLAATVLTSDTQLWTLDKRLQEVADREGVGYPA